MPQIPEIPDDVLKNLLEDDPELVTGGFYDACTKGNLELIKQLLRLYAHVISETDKTLGIKKAAGSGQTEVVDFLLKENAETPIEEKSLAYAASGGYTDIVKRLLPHCDPKMDGSLALSWAAEGGNLEVVKLLAPLSAPLRSKNTLTDVVEHGDTDILKLILPLCDPKYNNSLALQRACEQGNEDIFNILYPLSDPETALLDMTTKKNSYTKLLTDRLKIEASKKELEEHVGLFDNSITKPKHVRKF